MHPESPSKARPTWDHVFSSVNENQPFLPQNIGPRRPRRQTMTAQEVTAFNDIFDMIFDSMGENESASGEGPSSSKIVSSTDTGLSGVFGTLRRHSKKMKWTAEADEALDRKKDEMDRCNTDKELLDWAMREVFGESQLYLQDFREAEASVGTEVHEMPMLQPLTYPHLLALLMRTFRDKYRDPHLALSMFDYARHLSTPSYVFGCSTSAYNELIATRWFCFKDLKGVHDALEEMSVNGVDMDNKTQTLAETVRQGVGKRNLWMEENEMGSGAVWEMLNNIEKLVNQSSKSTPWNTWKAPGSPEQVDPNWEFDQW
ncbi:hypothetical protein FB45DRAFT_975224 [Roridomyces roridus]|uniref:Mtf2-like C-terminal domain-containing protein n=1 Tax=Roridomyces roridus TaxID=1738132 RepID=A0AAD7CFM7_9AGAR|nr:hypothetical protein FB45DRAFT_975224 [Roridomyces roridus]